MKNKKKILLSILAVTLCGCKDAETMATDISEKTTVVQTWTYNGEDTITAGKKEEMVNVEAKADGTTETITVTTTLSDIDGTTTVLDETDLTDIKNKNGDEQFVLNDGLLYWENLNAPISYSGTSVKSLPVNVHVTYYLNGKETNPEKMAGKSGNIKIRFDYTNNAVYEDVHVPFVCLSFVMLDEEDFSDVEVENGSLSTMDNTLVAFGYAMPSLADDLNLLSYEDLKEIEIPDYVEICATTTDFHIDFTETVISAGFLDIEDEDIQDLKDTSSDMKELSDGGNDLVEAGTSLSDGFTELQDGITAYLDGMNTVSESINTLLEGIGSLDEGAGTLNDGLQQLNTLLSSLDLSSVTSSNTGNNSQLTQLIETLNSLVTAQTITNNDGTTTTYYDMSSLDNELTSVLTKLKDANGTAIEIDNNTQSAILASFKATPAYQTYAASLYASSSALSNILATLTGMESLGNSLSSLQEAVKQLASGMSSLKQGTSSLKDGVSALNTGMKEAVNNNATIKDGMNSYKDGLQEYTKAIQEINTKVLQKLSQKLGTNLGEIIGSVEQLQRAKESYQTFTKLCDGQKGSVTFMIETAKIEN